MDMDIDMKRIIGHLDLLGDFEFGQERNPRAFGTERYGGLGFGNRNPNRRMKKDSDDKETIVAPSSDVECDDLPCTPTAGASKTIKNEEKKMKSENEKKSSKGASEHKKKGTKKEKTGSRKETQKLTKDEERRLLSPLFDSFGAGGDGER